MGAAAFQFVEMLAEAGLTVWQVLPLHPVRSVFGFSPYSPASCFAGNPLLIDEEKLIAEYGLPAEYLNDFPDTTRSDQCSWDERLKALKELFWRIYQRLEVDLPQQDAYQSFCAEAAGWLDDYALYETLVHHLGTSDWRQWPQSFRNREAEEIRAFGQRHAREINWQKFVQYTFFSQWQNLRRHCRRLGVRLLGDMPLYGQFDSSDVWSHPEVFEMDASTRQPSVVAGVPPDYFSQDGQFWGNPLYRWFDGDALHPPTVDWWRKRMAWALQQTDLIRIDHFRGLESYWAIPAKASSARQGSWRKGPNMAFFDSLRDILGDTPPLIAEDLGIITAEVELLRDRQNLPGMKILHFAFGGGDDHPYLPHNFDSRPWLLYLGTHDNNTTAGWLEEELSESEKEKVEAYVSWSREDSLIWKLIETAVTSSAQTVLLSINDLMEYGSETRFNVPGRANNNWSWKLTHQDIMPVLNRLGALCRRHNRTLPGNG